MSDGNEPRNGTGDSAERSDGASDGTGRNPFKARDDYDPEDFVQVRVKYKNRARFTDWYRTQYPDVESKPKQDIWVDKVFALGMDRIVKLMPPQLSAEDRLAAAMEGES